MEVLLRFSTATRLVPRCKRAPIVNCPLVPRPVLFCVCVCDVEDEAQILNFFAPHWRRLSEGRRAEAQDTMVKRMNSSFCFPGAMKEKQAKMSCWLNAVRGERWGGGVTEEEQQGEEVKKCKKWARGRDQPD